MTKPANWYRIVEQYNKIQSHRGRQEIRESPQNTVLTLPRFKSLGQRYLELHDEIADLDVMIAALVEELAPELIGRNSIGYESASQLLWTVGDNSVRLQSEANFAALCDVSLVPASSGKVALHRLNRGGDRASNCA